MSAWTEFRDHHPVGRVLAATIRFVDKCAALLIFRQWGYTVSAQCGARIAKGKACRFCRVLCEWLHKADDEHCRDSARHEGLLPNE